MYQVSCPANGLCHPRGLTTFYLVDGAADEWAADLKEAQPPVDLMGNADTHSRANVRSLSNRSPKPKRTAGTQVNSIQPLIYLQCSRKPSRPSRQISEFVGVAEPFHQVDSFERLNGAQQHSCANPWLFRRHVEHVGRPIDEVHISKPPVQEQGFISGCSSMIRMPTAIAWWVSLCLDDTTAHPVSPGFAHKRFPNKISGQLSRISRQAG